MAKAEGALRPTLVGRYREVRAATERLCRPLSAEDCALQSMPDASPTKWHLAHTTWFFETFVLERAVAGYRPLDPQYRYLFNSYYDTIGERHPRPERGMISRPSLEEIYDYRGRVDAAMLRLLERERLADEMACVVELGLHHEQQHEELILTDLKHVFSRNPLRPAYAADGRRPAGAGTVPLEWVAFPGGIASIGHDGQAFHFDNEAPRHRVFLEPFALASRLVTNGEYRAFVEDGGYERPELWLSDGWDAVRQHGWNAPLYWEGHEGGWWSLTLCGMRPLDDAEPACHVSYFESDAYSRWAGARLPTEAEWEVAASGAPVEGNLAESEIFHPVTAPTRAPRLGQMFGDVWEWTA
ncbi:MAG: ergothioneine biosynthesis protein EgtB, partial [Candidatus Binatia bacterium]